MKKNKANITTSIVLFLLTFIVSIPFFIMIIGSIKPSISLIKIPIDLNPFSNITLSNIKNVIDKSDIVIWIRNSLIVSISVAVITSVMSLMAGYAFARIKMRGAKILFVLVIATMLMPKQLLLIPNYLVAYKLNLQNTLIGLILTSISPAFGIFLSRQMISTIPKDIFDAADIDGCSEIRKFIKIVLPISLPTIGTISIFSFFEVFNDYLWQLIMISNKKLMTLPVGIAMYAQKLQGNRGIQLALALLGTIPLVVIFVMCQKFFIKQSTSGAIKG